VGEPAGPGIGDPARPGRDAGRGALALAHDSTAPDTAEAIRPTSMEHSPVPRASFVLRHRRHQHREHGTKPNSNPADT
jgi:hypothetical protein